MRRNAALALVAALAIPTTAVVLADTAAAEFETPSRVLDTRAGIGADRGRVRAGEVIRLRIPSVSVSGETVALLNLTAVDAAGWGHVIAWPCGADETVTAALNYQPGRAVPNMVALRYTSAGICLRPSTDVHLVADFTGSTTDGDIRGITPQRLVDTRDGRRYAARRDHRVDVAGRASIPAGAVGAALNVTVVQPAADGWLLVKPCGSDSDAATVNYRAGEVVGHMTFAALSGGDVCVYSTQPTDVVIDAFAWMGASSGVRSVTPARLMDSRTGLGGTFGPFGDGRTVTLRVAGRAGVPNDAEAATINLAVADAAHAGHVTVWPCDAPRPTVASITMWPGMTRSNQATIELSRAGELCMRTVIGGPSTISLIVDAVGYVAGDVVRDEPPDEPPPTGRFETLPVGASLPTGAECAARVRPAAEIRPENATANSTRGFANGYRTGEWAEFGRVDGNFVGTTDEIIQWAACKWGIDEDIVRAQIVKESFWYMSANGDGGDSYGLGQVRVPYHGNRPGPGFPGDGAFEADNAVRSSAYNLDYTYAVWRACFEGVFTWLNTVERGATYGPGDAWGCTGVWFSGRWYTQAAINYIEGGSTGGYGSTGVKEHFRSRTWETASFING